MKNKNISQIIENINPKYIDEAAKYNNKTIAVKKNLWYKRAVAAACCVFALAICIPIIKSLHDKKTVDNDKNLVDSLILIEYENAYLEIIENSKSAEKLGLNKKITKDVIGKHITYLTKEKPDSNRSNFIKAHDKTNFELFEYSPAPHKAVRIFKNGSQYYYAVFNNYLINTNESLPIKNAFEIFGISRSSDISCIIRSESGSWDTDNKTITDSAAISLFFDEISKLPDFSFDDYHNLVFGGKLKNKEDISNDAYTRFANDRKDVIIETIDGIRFKINYYPSYKWIYISTTMSYYKMSPSILKWFSEYIK